MDVRNRVVIISGASSGIGRSLAQHLSAKGSKVVLLARREEKLKEIEAELINDQRDVLIVKTDVTDSGQVSDAVRLTLDRFGRIDVVINNAGAGYFGTVEKMPAEEFDRLVKTNVFGMLYLTQSTIPELKKTRGMIVNISSGLSKRALPLLAGYASTKSMIDALSDGMRLELKKYGVKVLNYCPPETDTEFFATTVSETGLDHHRSGDRKKARAEDVAARIVRAMEAEKREVVEGRFLQVMNFYCPRLLDNMFYKGMVQRIIKD